MADLPPCTKCRVPLNTGGRFLKQAPGATTTINMVDTTIQCPNCGALNVVTGSFDLR